VRPPGILAIDILDLDYGRIRAGEPPFARVEADWAIITEFSAPAPDRFVRDATTFVPDGAGACGAAPEAFADAVTVRLTWRLRLPMRLRRTCGTTV